MRWIVEPKAAQSSVEPASTCWYYHGCIIFSW